MDRDTNTMLPSLAKLKKPSSKDTGLVSILQDPSDMWCTRHLAYLISDPEKSYNDGMWAVRFAYLKAAFVKGFADPINYIKPYIISDANLNEEVSHLNSYGQYLFACGSRSTHMTYSYRGALGCALAHLRVWNAVKNCERDFCLVCEDNVYFGEGTPQTLTFYEKKFVELEADYMMLHTLGPFEDYCAADETKVIASSSDMQYDVPFDGSTVNVKEKLYALDRPMMSTKAYFISKRFAIHMYHMLYELYETDQMPAMHVDALLSLEAIRDGYKAFYRAPSRGPTSELEASIFDNVDNNRSFIGVLKKGGGSGIRHTTPVASKNAQPHP